MRDKNNRMQRLQNSMETYRKASVFLKANKLVIFNTTMITFVQRILLFAVTYVVYRSFGLNEQSLLTMILLQAAISVSVDMLPLPGGMGISERLFLQIFAPLFGNAFKQRNQLLYAGYPEWYHYDHHPYHRKTGTK